MIACTSRCALVALHNSLASKDLRCAACIDSGWQSYSNRLAGQVPYQVQRRVSCISALGCTGHAESMHAHA